MTTNAINLVNAGLMILASALAFVLPFQVFLFAYAVLGPLHYLTQISWLHDRGYFARRRSDALVLLGFTIAALVASYTTADPGESVRRAAPFVCLAFATAVVMAFSSSVMTRVMVPLVLGALILAFRVPLWIVLLGFFLTTVIHVFVLTALFVLAGSLRSRSVSGMLSFAVMVACGAACLLAPASGITPGPGVREVYTPFVVLNVHLAALFGWEPFRTFDELFGSPAGIAVMRFIAFSYTYHYLNWFSKTKVIGWHEIPRWRAVTVLAAWALAVGLYVVDYRIGVATLAGLSLLHVLLEFPLDHSTLVDLGRRLSMARP